MNPPKINMAQRVALFHSLEHGFTSIFAVPEWRAEQADQYAPSGYMRVSEWQDVQFIPSTDSERAASALAGLNAEREATVREFTQKLAKLDGRIANLRAITYEPAKADVSSIRMCLRDECEDYAEPGSRFCVTHGDEV